MFLPIAMATTNPLLNALWIPRQIIIDHEATELEIDPLRARFGGNHDGGTLPECLNQRSAYVHTFRAGEHVLSGMTLEPVVIDVQRIWIVIRAIQGNDAPGIAIGLQQLFEVTLGAPRLREDECLARGS